VPMQYIVLSFEIDFYFSSVLAVAGEDFAVIASDSRLSEGFSIHTRDQPKTYQLTKTTVVGACGFHGDVLTLMKVLQRRIKVNILKFYSISQVCIHALWKQVDLEPGKEIISVES